MAYQSGTQVIKGERAVIEVAGKPIEVFMLPNGDYVYSQASACESIGKDRNDWSNYLRSNKGSTGRHPSAETPINTLEDFAEPPRAKGSTGRHQGTLVSIGRTRVKAINDVQVAAYWSWKSKNGSVEAEALLTALVSEALARRADDAFGIKKAEATYEQQTTTLRLDLIEHAKAQYMAGNKDEVYSTLSETEEEISLLMVTIERLKLSIDDLDNWLMRHKDSEKLEIAENRLKALLGVPVSKVAQ
ncbi:MAG: hypothetical protein KME59_21355 [Trichormus sp. ATA11-4-KO1]|jgi:hypothetical protein|nr:hypothetical protein [Trichormus sp. ATA11-4-KO1]